MAIDKSDAIVAPTARITPVVGEIVPVRIAHTERPATIAASDSRSSTPSSNLPRGVARSCNLAASPSIPSRIDVRDVRIAPTIPAPVPRSHAATSPVADAAAEMTSGWIRRGAMVIDSRVETGRLT